MKKIYIVMTQTGTILSMLVKLRTGCEYGHVSIALDENLDEMYSFGRLNPYNPFLGGFVHEKINAGTFKRFKNTRANVCYLEIEDYKYDLIKHMLYQMEKSLSTYKFNILGLLGAAINVNIMPRKDTFYCAEFVKYLLEYAGIETKLPGIVIPDKFKNMEGIVSIYKGKLSSYRENKTHIINLKTLNKLTAINENKEKNAI